MKVEGYRVVRQGRGVPMVKYAMKAYLRYIVQAIHMCMCEAMVLPEEEGICIFHK
jgi:hypothetical protein